MSQGYISENSNQLKRFLSNSLKFKACLIKVTLKIKNNNKMKYEIMKYVNKPTAPQKLQQKILQQNVCILHILNVCLKPKQLCSSHKIYETYL